MPKISWKSEEMFCQDSCALPQHFRRLTPLQHLCGSSCGYLRFYKCFCGTADNRGLNHLSVKGVLTGQLVVFSSSNSVVPTDGYYYYYKSTDLSDTLQ